MAGGAEGGGGEEKEGSMGADAAAGAATSSGNRTGHLIQMGEGPGGGNETLFVSNSESMDGVASEIVHRSMYGLASSPRSLLKAMVVINLPESLWVHAQTVTARAGNMGHLRCVL
jgi:hypothetical protein